MQYYNSKLGTGYAHRLLTLDIFRGDLGRAVAMSRNDLTAYRAGHQFAEIDARGNQEVQSRTPQYELHIGRQLCECWVWIEEPGTPGHFNNTGPGWPHCDHKLSFGQHVMSVNSTTRVRHNPLTSIPYFDRFTREQHAPMVALMRAYGWGYFHGTFNSPWEGNRFIIQYRNSDYWSWFELQFQEGFAHGMEYAQSMLTNQTEEVEYRG